MYTGPVDCAKRIYQVGGLRGLFKGLIPTTLRETIGKHECTSVLTLA